MKMNRILRILSVSIIVASLSGCGEQEQLGGGSRSIVAGTTANAAVYGIRSGKELAFVIFTDLPSEGTRSSAGSTWTGQIQPTTGPAVQYEGDPDGLTINGTRYGFANGRVFLVTATGGTVSAKQLNIPIGSASYDVEIDSLTKQKEIQDHLAP